MAEGISSRMFSVRQNYSANRTSQTQKSIQDEVKIVGEELVKARGIDVRKINITVEDLKKIDIEFLKGHNKDLNLYFIGINDNNQKQYYNWLIGIDVKEFNIIKEIDDKGKYIISLKIIYKNQLEPKIVNLYSINGEMPGP